MVVDQYNEEEHKLVGVDKLSIQECIELLGLVLQLLDVQVVRERYGYEYLKLVKY